MKKSKEYAKELDLIVDSFLNKTKNMKGATNRKIELCEFRLFYLDKIDEFAKEVVSELLKKTEGVNNGRFMPMENYDISATSTPTIDAISNNYKHNI
jgi:hypothetical protein